MSSPDGCSNIGDGRMRNQKWGKKVVPTVPRHEGYKTQDRFVTHDHRISNASSVAAHVKVWVSVEDGW